MPKVRAIVCDATGELILPGSPYATVTTTVYDGDGNVSEQRRTYVNESQFSKLPKGGTPVNQRIKKGAENSDAS